MRCGHHATRVLQDAGLFLAKQTMSLHAHLPEASGVWADGHRTLSLWGSVLALLTTIAVLDAVTGYEVSVFLLYTIPVALSTHYLGVRSGVLLSVLAMVAWVVADRWSGHTYTRDWILVVNALNRFCCFLLAVMAVRYVAERRAAEALRLRAFTGKVPLCHQCDRLCGEDGLWRKPEVYLVELGGAEVPSKVCPDCARRGYARAAYRGHPEAADIAPDITPDIAPQAASGGAHPQEAHA